MVTYLDVAYLHLWFLYLIVYVAANIQDQPEIEVSNSAFINKKEIGLTSTLDEIPIFIFFDDDLNCPCLHEVTVSINSAASLSYSEKFFYLKYRKFCVFIFDATKQVEYKKQHLFREGFNFDEWFPKPFKMFQVSHLLLSACKHLM